jgi:NADPH:quinone reductase-like Zn-dependent oxidoreductase
MLLLIEKPPHNGCVRCVLGTCNFRDKHAAIVFALYWGFSRAVSFRGDFCDVGRTRQEQTVTRDTVSGMDLTKKLEVLIRPAYALEHAAEAHRCLESRKSIGKLVLSVGG